MSFVIRAAAVYLGLVAVAVAVNFIATPWYHPGGDVPFTAWEYLNWFMAVGMIIAVVAGYAEKRRLDGGGPSDLKDWLGANALFYGAAALLLVFFWNWFSNLAPNAEADGQFWAIIDTTMPLVLGAAGCRLWRNAGS